MRVVVRTENVLHWMSRGKAQGTGKEPRIFLRPNVGELFITWLREMEGTISQYNLRKEKNKKKQK